MFIYMSFTYLYHHETQDGQGEEYEAFVRHTREADVFFVARVTSGPAIDLLPQHVANVPSVIVFDSSPRLQALARLGGTPVAQPRRACIGSEKCTA